MKKMIVLLAVLLLCLSLTACSGDPADTKGFDDAETVSDNNTANNASSAAETEAVSDTLNADGDLEAVINAYLKSDNGQDMIESFREGAEANGNLTFDSYADGNYFVFESKFNSEIPESSFESVKKEMDDTFAEEETKATFEALKLFLQTTLSDDRVGVKVIYLTKDGELVAEKVY